MVIAHAYLVERCLPDLIAEQVAEATNRTKALARDAGIKLADYAANRRHRKEPGAGSGFLHCSLRSRVSLVTAQRRRKEHCEPEHRRSGRLGRCS